MTFAILIHGWLTLFVAIIFGVIGTVLMKLSHGLSDLKHIVYIGFFYLISFIGLTLAMKYIELSTVYAVWSGVGTILMAAIGILFFHESISFRKILYLCCIIIGVIGIHLNDLF